MTPAHRVAIIGAGQVSEMHFRGYLDRPDRVNIVAAVDPAKARREWVSENFGVTSTYPSIASLLEHEKFDIAVICTPSHVRLAAVQEVAAAGKHIFVEKPMADSLAEASQVVAAAEKARVRIAVNQNFRDHYAFGLAADSLQSGRVGKIYSIQHCELTYRRVSGWRAQMNRNALSVMGVHWLDGFRQLVDQEADRVSARVYSSPQMEASGDTDAFVQVQFGEVSVNYAQSFSSRVERCETVVLGEKGTLRLTYGALEIYDENGVERIPNPCAGVNKPMSAFRALNKLLTSIEASEEPSNSGRDNLKTLSLLEAVYTSAHSREPVNLKGGLL